MTVMRGIRDKTARGEWGFGVQGRSNCMFDCKVDESQVPIASHSQTQQTSFHIFQTYINATKVTSCKLFQSNVIGLK